MRIRACFSVHAICLLVWTYSGQSLASSNCQNATGRIIQDGQHIPKKWPAIAAFRRLNYPDKVEEYFCGGSVIHPNWVLTAAHCVAAITKNGAFHVDQFGRKIEVVIGTGDLTKVREFNKFQIEKVIVHEKFSNAELEGHDIALVRLKRRWNGVLARISANRKTDPFPDGAHVEVAGYGSQSMKNGKPQLIAHKRNDEWTVVAGSHKLKEVFLATVRRARCVARYPAPYKVGDGQICAGYETSGIDSCNGDSGGPLSFLDADGRLYQVGIVSWGRGCAEGGNYGVYSRVSHYYNWILRRGVKPSCPVIVASPVSVVTIPEQTGSQPRLPAHPSRLPYLAPDEPGAVPNIIPLEPMGK